MLQVNSLTKKFDSSIVVDHESFTLEPGEILGLIGQNGAGKTTTFRMILGFLKPDTGQVCMNGKRIGPNDFNNIGYLPEERSLYPKMKIQDQIIYFARLHGMKTSEIKQSMFEWFDQLQVKGNLNGVVKDLSKGNQQKIQLITTLIHKPKLIILDEPFSGLDPVNAGLLQDRIIALRDQGSSIIYSSHDMANVAAISDKLLMLKHGKTVLSGTLAAIQNSFGRTKLFIESNLSAEELLAFKGVTHIVKRHHQYELTLASPEIGETIFNAATKNGYIPEFRQTTPSLTEIFKTKVGVEDA
ncbi:MAG: ABC transporter ATP-binding protein [Lactobacillus sp.]|jgi:ABC-2 type transport system ATP-binding protein|nr:ABC transporter ATP-binding protein [Lactobacillus sp.]